MSVLARAGLRYLGRHPAQLALSVLGIALGVSVVVGIDLAATSARRAFESASDSVAGRATHALVAGGRDLDEALYAKLRREPRTGGAPALAPVLERRVVALDAGGRSRRVLTLLGVDPLAEAPFRSLGGPAQGTPWAALELAGSLDGALLARRTADELGLADGERLRLECESREVGVVVRIVDPPPEGPAAAALDDLLVVDIATAQELARAPGRLTRIDVRLAGSAARAAEQRAWLAERLPAGVALVDAEARRASLVGMTRAFETNLNALGLLALFVGAFLVYNTVTFSVVQRRGLFASLRTLGVRRGEIFRLLCGEALALGLLGSLAGLALGALVGSLLVRLVARTVNDLYFSVDVTQLAPQPTALLRGLALGLAGTLLAALVPALEATRQAPRTAQMRSTLESGTRARTPLAALLGVLVSAGALGLLELGPGGLDWSFVALFALLLGSALCAPLITLGLCRAASPLLGAAIGNLGRLAARGLARNLSRNAVAVAALSIAVASTLGMGLLIGSFRATVDRWLLATLRSDVFVSAPSTVASRNLADLPADMRARLDARADVSGSTTYRGFETRDAEGQVLFGAALDLDPRSRAAYVWVEPPPDDLWERFEAGAVLLSQPLAHRRGLAPGGRLELATDHGLESFEVAAVYYDYSSDQGFALLARDVYERYFDDRGVSSISLFLAPGADPEGVAAELREQLPPGELVHVRSNAELRSASLVVFDRTFRVTEVLRLFAGAVAFVATLSALLALQFEREREIGVLRALGLTPRGVRLLVLRETGLLGGAAGLCALPLGAALCWLLARHVNVQSFGWTISTHYPPLPFAEAFGLALAAALLAALWPAWRLSSGSPGRALWNE